MQEVYQQPIKLFTIGLLAFIINILTWVVHPCTLQALPNMKHLKLLL